MSRTTTLAERGSTGEDDTMADVEGPDGADAPPGGGEPRRRWVLGWVLLAVSLAVAVSGSIAWWSSAHSEELQLARTRDAVLVQATRDIGILNSLDAGDVEAGLDAWRSVTTGTLHDQFSGLDEQDRRLLADQGKVSKGRVVEAAVLDVDGGTAEVIASVETTVTDAKDASAEPAVKRNRFTATLARSGGEWKVSDLQQLAVDLS
jgi:Mce-associated membrane protein